VTPFRNGLPRAALLAGLLATAACSGVEQMSDSKLTLDTPIEWWHDLQGGKIAEVRPPPPGVDDPYPNLSQVPPRPTPTDPATRRALAARLVAERDRTRQEATQDPLVLPAPIAPVAATAPAVAPVPAAARSAAPAPDPGASVAVLEAATAPPPAQTPPAQTPAPLPVAAPPASTAPVAAPPPGPAAMAAGGPQQGKPAVESGPVPELPNEAPPLPRLRGIPASVNAPPVPRLPPGVSVAFRPGSAALPAGADAALRELAERRAGAAIAVATGGDAARPDAVAQARALPLAWRRAQSMQDALVAAGVPAGSLRINAAALGRGGEAHLLQ
jgi:outer membrane protein OmpA-like peptidoglycan-associated protein